MVNLIADLMQDWRRLDERIETVSTEIEALALQDDSCQRLMTGPGVGPIISSAMVARLQPVAASIVPHDWPAASMRSMPALRSVSSGRPL
jgi:transposase